MAPNTSCEVELITIEFLMEKVVGKFLFPMIVQLVVIAENNSTTNCILYIWNHSYETIPTTGCEAGQQVFGFGRSETVAAGKPSEGELCCQKQSAVAPLALHGV